MMTLYVAYGVSVVLVALGFVALLKQKTYIDPATNQPTGIELPVLGKLKTNYPALVFVFLGVGLAAIAFEKSYPPRKVPWTVMGSFLDPSGKGQDWRNGTLTVVPSDVMAEVSNMGTFRITANIDEGKSFEDAFELIDYSNAAGSALIRTKSEYSRYLQGDNTSLVRASTPMTREFKPKPLDLFR